MNDWSRQQEAETVFRTLVGRLRFRHLQLMVALDRSGSLRTAARELHLTQSALSKALKEIEDAFDARLFERTQSGLKPTDEGLIVTRGARLLLGELHHLGEETSLAAGRAAAILRMGVLPFLAPWLAPQLARALRDSEPGLLLRLRQERVPVLMSELLAGELDALVTTYTVETERFPAASSLDVEILFAESFCVIAAPSRRARRGPIAWKDVAGEPWILPARFTFLRRQVDEAFLRQGLRPPEPVIESSDAATNVSLVAAGLGLSMVPKVVLERCAGSVRILNVEPALEPTRVALIHRPGAQDHPRVQLLRAALGAVLGARPSA